MRAIIGLLALTSCDRPCGSSAGPERDRCLHDRVIAAETPAEVEAAAQQIEDLLYRSAAVQMWVIEHRETLPLADGQRLCATLPGVERTSCEHRLVSVHLAR